MILQVEFSAPKGATHYIKHFSEPTWYKKEEGKWLMWQASGKVWEHSYIQTWKVEPQPIRCLWTYDEEFSTWETYCKNGYVPDDGVSLEEIGFKFCPYCGKEIHHETSTSQD